MHTMNPRSLALLLASHLSLASLCSAQPTAAEQAVTGIPEQVKHSGALKFKHPSFTFVRIKYSVGKHSVGKHGLGSTPERWKIDWPDSDLNFFARFQKVTGLKTDTNALVL